MNSHVCFTSFSAFWHYEGKTHGDAVVFGWVGGTVDIMDCLFQLLFQPPSRVPS